ncbi:hypothetical protein QBC36DRAFT_315410 [Triangularia setosa]|uniref:Uncharacterized protein n=1 Tax=Triangularia setosa TaxID=2587417 RepID=A0AAN7A1H4_9PEZI|nr:hypothetical protein QBC36DRAFT_315410 [Podospora setosa]
MYRPLSKTDFRAVHLLLANFSDEIKCVLVVQSFKVKASYEAVSYQQGDDDDLRTIHIRHLDRTPPQPDYHLANLFLDAFGNAFIVILYMLKLKVLGYVLFLMDKPVVSTVFVLWLPTMPVIISEVRQTKPWGFIRSFKVGDVPPNLRFGELKIPPSLDLALRCLGSKTKVQTL